MAAADPEITAMKRVLKVIEGLKPDEAARVLAWAAQKVNYSVLRANTECAQKELASIKQAIHEGAMRQ